MTPSDEQVVLGFLDEFIKRAEELADCQQPGSDTFYSDAGHVGKLLKASKSDRDRLAERVKELEGD